MKKTIIIGVNKYYYLLQDEELNKYNINIEFVGFNEEVLTGDILYLSEELLNEPQPYTFGPLNSQYARELETLEDADTIILETKTGRTFLQRYYG